MAIKRSVELKRVIVQIVCNVENQVESGEGEKKREKTDEKKMSKTKTFKTSGPGQGIQTWLSFEIAAHILYYLS